MSNTTKYADWLVQAAREGKQDTQDFSDVLDVYTTFKDRDESLVNKLTATKPVKTQPPVQDNQTTDTATTFSGDFARDLRLKMPGFDYLAMSEINPQTGTFSPIKKFVKPAIKARDTFFFDNVYKQDENFIKNFNKDFVGFLDKRSSDTKRVGSEYKFPDNYSLEQKLELFDRYDGRELLFSDGQKQKLKFLSKKGTSLIEEEKKKADNLFYLRSSPSAALVAVASDPNSKFGTDLLKDIPLFGDFNTVFNPFGSRSIENFLNTVDESVSSDPKYAAFFAKEVSSGRLRTRQLASRFNNLLQAGAGGVLFLYGEGAEFTINMLNKIPKVQIETYGGLETSEQREAFLTRWFPNAAKDFQMYLNSKGIYDVSIETAESILSFNNNIVERGMDIAAESITAGGLLGKATEKLAMRQAKNFTAYVKKHGKKYDSLEEAIEGFIANKYVVGKNGQPVGPRGAGLLGDFLNSMQRGSLTNAVQFYQTTLPTKLRIEVKTAQAYRDNIVKKIANENPKENSVRFRELNRLKNEADTKLAAAKTWSNVPPVLREMGKAELRVVLYGAAAGQTAQQFGFDPVFGELLGIIQGGIIAPIADMNRYTTFLNIDSDIVKAYEYMQYGTLKALEELGGASKTIGVDFGVERGTYLSETIGISSQMGLKKFADVLSKSNPEIVEAVRQRVTLLNKYKERLMKQGVPEEVFNTTLAKLTGLSVLNAFDSIYGEAIHSGSVLTTKAIEQANQSTLLKIKLKDELIDLMKQIAPDSINPEKSADLSAFLAQIDNGIKETEADIKIKSDALNTLTANQEGVLIRGLIDDSDLQNEVDDALEILFDYSGVKLGPNATLEDKYRDVLEKSNVIQDQISSEVRRLIDTYNTSADKTIFGDELLKVPAIKKEVLEQTGELQKEIFIPKLAKNLATKKITSKAVSNKIDQLLAVSVEARRAEIHAKAGLIYSSLDTKYKGATGNITNVFESVISASLDDAKPIKDMAKASIAPADINKLVSAFNNTARKMLDEAGVPRDAIIDDIKQLNANIPTNSDAYLLYHVMTNPNSQFYEDAKDIAVEINFEDMFRLRSAVQKRIFKSSSVETGVPEGESAIVYRQFGKDIEDVFNNFKMPDGSTPVDLQKSVKEANSLFQREVADKIYKKNSIFRDWLPADKSMAITKERPTGKGYVNEPELWINMEKLSKKSLSGDFQRKIKEAFGELDPTTGEYTVDISKYKGFSSVLDFKLKIWIQQQRKTGKRIEEINEGMRNIARAFHMQGDQYLVDPEKLVGSSGYFSLTEAARRNSKIGKEKKAAELEIKKAFEKTVLPARLKLEAEQRNIQDLRELISRRLDADQGIPAGGPIRGRIQSKEDIFKYLVADEISGDTLTRLQVEAEKGGMKAEDFNTAVKSLVGEYISDMVYKSTARKILGLKGSGEMEVLDSDFKKLTELISINEKQLRRVLGDDHYDVLRDISGYMELESAKNVEQASLTGIPRALSVESYISRLYSINREVVSPKYVATETAVQQFRLRNIRLLKAIIQDKNVAKLFGEMIETGRPLSADKNNRFFASLLLAAGRYSAQEEYTAADLYVKPALGATVPFSQTAVGDVPIPFTKGSTLNKQMQSLNFMGVGKGDIQPFADDVNKVMGVTKQ